MRALLVRLSVDMSPNVSLQSVCGSCIISRKAFKIVLSSDK